MSWLPAMMFMHMHPVEQHSTRCNAGYTPVVTEVHPPVIDGTPANNSNSNSTQSTPTVATRSWHHTAMSVTTFTLSALLAYIATEAIWKRIRGRN